MNNTIYLEEFCKNVGKQLKKAREDCGLPMEEGARKTEHSIAIMTEIERGSYNVLTTKSVSRLFGMFLTYGFKLELAPRPFDPNEMLEKKAEELIRVMSKKIVVEKPEA